MISKKIINGILGNINIPSDKSISHRSIIIPSISKGVSEINNLLMSDDVLNTLNAFKTLGVKIEQTKRFYIFALENEGSFKQGYTPLDPFGILMGTLLLTPHFPT